MLHGERQLDLELLLTMLINMQYLQIKTLSKFTDDKETLEEATMIVKESQKLLERIMTENEKNIGSDLGFELADKQEENSFRKRLWKR
jgi:hypothetical protein